MKIIVTGSLGLVGSAVVEHFARKAEQIIGIDNDHRSYFFGSQASTEKMQKILQDRFSNYKHLAFDIRDHTQIMNLIQEFQPDL